MFYMPKSASRRSVAFCSLLLGTALAPMAVAGGGSQHYAPNALPNNPVAGQCYARVKHDAQYATESEIVIVQDAYQRLDVDQAQLVSRQEQVVIKEASTRFEVRQPSYRSVTEQVMTRPSYEKLSVSAPEFRNVTETVLVSQPRIVWKRGNPGALAAQGYNVLTTANTGYSGSSQSYGTGTNYGSHNTTNHGQAASNQCGANCEIWCLVEEPGESITYNRKVLANPGQIVRKSVPAKYTSVHKQVVSDPGGVREIPVPAQYKSITMQDVVHPGGERFVNVPAETGKIDKKVLVSAESYEWMRVICNTGQVVGSAPQSFTPPASQSYGSTSSYNGATSSHSGQTSSYGSGSYTSSNSHNSVTYGEQPASSNGSGYNYYDNAPSSLSYGSTTHGNAYQGSSEPRIYGGEGMNAHHSAGSH